jgi:hypothetical protein
MAAVSSVNLVIHKGTDFEEVFTLSDDANLGLNLTGHTAVCKLRKHPNSSSSYNFTTSLTVSDSSVRIEMDNNTTSLLPRGRCYYDLVLISPDGFISKVVEGNVLVEDSSSV